MGKSKELATLTDVGGTIDGALNINGNNSKISASNNHLILHDTAETDTGSNWWYIYRNNGKAGALSFYRGVDRMTIDASGRVTMPYQAGFAAYSPATGTGGQNPIVYGSTYHNIGNHYNTSTGIFTAPIAGRYLFTASCLFNYSSGAYHRLDFRLNGSVYNSYGETLENQAGPSYSSATISNIFSLNANDTMQMWNGSNTTTYGSSYGHFSGIMLA